MKTCARAEHQGAQRSCKPLKVLFVKKVDDRTPWYTRSLYRNLDTGEKKSQLRLGCYYRSSHCGDVLWIWCPRVFR